ncbi:MAG: hypothetical protein JNK79_04030 [Chitinophagaceae bacterium]|nr:hypothetical protein [Chitinophagaceae bacterium]
MIHKIKTGIFLCLFAGFQFFTVSASGQQNWNTATSKDTSYNWPMIGNGNIQTIIGPNGFHNGKSLEVETVNRAVFWAGRRHRDARTALTWIPRFDKDIPIGASQPLVRFGRTIRELVIDGKTATDDDWSQTLDYDKALVRSELKHQGVNEVTESMILLSQNIMLFHTTLTNTSSKEVDVKFTLKYEFGDAYGNLATGTKLFVFRPYPTDKLFGSVDGKFSTDPDVESRAPHVEESLLIKYEVEDHLGQIHWGRYPGGRIEKTLQGGNFIHDIKLGKGESRELWFWMVMSDRYRYTYFPKYEELKELVNSHLNEWKKFWLASSVKLGNPTLENVYKSSLYTLRCNSGEWSSSCGILASNWEGRFLHDEMYIFFGLISSNHPKLARTIPNWRWLTRQYAMQRSKGHGTFYSWESTETGLESAPMGQWVDERYIHGEISEHVWRYYLYTGDKKSLEQFYPVLKGNVEWLIHDILKYDEDGKIYLRPVVSPVEHVFPAKNEMYTVCAFARALKVAATAANILKTDKDDAAKWLSLSDKIKKLMPVDANKNVFKISENMDDTYGVAHLGSIFPFAVDIDSRIPMNTLNEAVNYFFKAKEERTTDLVFSTTTWLWGLSNLASACFVAGEGDKGFKILQDAGYTVGSFQTPAEHWNRQDGAYLPWHTTAAGAYLAAVNGMFVQVYDDQLGAVLFPALSPELKNCSFNRLLASQGVSVSGNVKDGKVTALTAYSDSEKKWVCAVPQSVAKNLKFSGIVSSRTEGKMVKLICKLNKGDNQLIQ